MIGIQRRTPCVPRNPDRATFCLPAPQPLALLADMGGTTGARPRTGRAHAAQRNTKRSGQDLPAAPFRTASHSGGCLEFDPTPNIHSPVPRTKEDHVPRQPFPPPVARDSDFASSLPSSTSYALPRPARQNPRGYPPLYSSGFSPRAAPPAWNTAPLLLGPAPPSRQEVGGKAESLSCGSYSPTPLGQADRAGAQDSQIHRGALVKVSRSMQGGS
jgi:hypothetical protein